MHSEASPPPDRPPRRVGGGAWMLIPIMLIAAVLRTQRLSEVSYWFDESFCVKMAEFSPAEIWERSGQDTHPPLYFLLLKGWGLLFGTSPAALRLLSGTLGVAAIVGIFLFVREAYTKRPGDRRGNGSGAVLSGLIAAALVALSPLHIVWSLQVRMYVLGTAVTAFSSWFLMRALRRERTRTADWVLYTFTAILLAYAHYFGLFTLAAQYVFAASYLWFDPRSDAPAGRLLRLKPALISAICLAISWQLWMPTFLAQRERVTEVFWTKPVSWELMSDTFDELFGVSQRPFARSSSSELRGLAIAQAAVLALLVLVLGRRPADGYVALAASLPFVAAIAVSMGPRSIIVARYFQFAHIFLLVALAVLVCRIPWRLLRSAGILLVLGGMGTLAWSNYERREELAEQPGLQAALARLDELRQPGEPLIACHPQVFLSVIPYVDRDGVYALHPGDQQTPFSNGSPVMREEDYLSPESLNDTSAVSAWTLDASHFKGQRWAVPMPPGWRQAGESRFTEYYYGELVLRLYTREESASDNSSARATLIDENEAAVYSRGALQSLQETRGSGGY